MIRIDFSNQLSEDRRTTTLTISEDDVAKVAMSLTAADLEGMIQNLANQRAAMLDEPPLELIPGNQMFAIDNPIVGTSEERIKGNRLLAIRHPGMGWLAFFIPDENAKLVADWMTRPLP